MAQFLASGRNHYFERKNEEENLLFWDATCHAKLSLV